MTRFFNIFLTMEKKYPKNIFQVKPKLQNKRKRSMNEKNFN